MLSVGTYPSWHYLIPTKDTANDNFIKDVDFVNDLCEIDSNLLESKQNYSSVITFSEWIYCTNIPNNN